MKLFRWLVLLLVVILLVDFAVSNRVSVDLELWPLPFDLPAPLYAVALLLLAAGYLLGELLAWLRSLRRRRDFGRQKKQIAALEAALARAKADDAAAVVQSSGTPAAGTALMRRTGS